MLNSIHIGTSGLVGYSKELQTISNNVANLNTPGYKGANLQFTALFSQGGGSAISGHGGSQVGSGLATLNSVIDFSQGQINASANDLDAAVDGPGFFVLRDKAGELFYTRDGRFNFNTDGILVSSTSGEHVQGFNAQGTLQDITLENLNTNAALATTNITLGGTLSTADTTKTVGGVIVTDGAGGSHTLSVEFTNNTATTPGSWLVTVMDGTTTVATGEIRYDSGLLDPAYSTVSFTYSPTDVAPMPLTLTIDASSTSAASGTSTMAVSSIDGHGIGAIVGETYDDTGHLVVNYSNGQTDTSQQLALAKFTSTDSLESVNGNKFKCTNSQSAVLGVADGSVSAIKAKSLEASNVDLSKEFSAIIIAQRGYQASSELVSTANQMLDTLMRMKG